MIKTNEKTDKIINFIENEKCSFGNKLLYNMCKDEIGQKWDDVNVLADKIWLIGRSYAASPERRCSKGKATKVGDGTGKYFKSVAEYLCDNASNSKESQEKLNGEYKFNFSSYDKELLLATVKAVEGLNSYIRKASIDFDEYKVEESNYKNQISFCSKFLHFHFPNTVFIIDGFSKKSATTLLSNKTLSVFYKDITFSNSEIKELLNNENISDFENEFSTDIKSFEEPIKDYAKHCLRAYKVACVFKKYLGDKNTENSYPRMVDTLLLDIKF